jgi:hypothetical protein
MGMRPKSSGQGVRQATLLFDPKNGATVPFDKAIPPPVVRQRPREANDALGIRLRQGSSSVKEGKTTVSVGTLWAESIETATEEPRVLVSADSSGGQFSPNGEALLFRSQGALLVAPLVRIDKETYAAARETARRMQVLNNAKQLGLAALMYSQDYDDALPTGENINSKLDPYIKNNSLFDGFSYTFPGGALKDIEKPSETELGFVTGPGGKAVIYVDGHVKWRSDK